MAIAALAGRAVSTTLAWLLAHTFELPKPGVSLRPADDLDRWLDTVHELAERAAQRRATRKREGRPES